MPGYVIHVAIAQEYIKKHNNKKENNIEFIKGVIYPDSISPKSESHYGKSPAYTDLKRFLENNEIKDSFSKGKFLHLITDYLFYNYYLEFFSKQDMYNDYDILNEKLIRKYNVKLPKEVREYVFFKDGDTKILNMFLACKIIDEISSMDIEIVEKEVMKDEEKWKYYKNIV